ncbi:PorT family protein [Aureisphaera sp. CAU 1614]|uniref:PorT family protein n=1 Tax=Halomarinibacterium sedimenti TaxID=2857106 RepID=A0A9X1FQQ6_9FLAO|nr:porin family protein [Halomarinibacterium sedimenti]MBW2938964.1 PorT family protein [Halomarinibacterium sedimenti]
MKKVLILLAITLSSTTFYAQDLDLGIKAGMNFSNITDATGLSNKTGFVFGAFAGAKLGDKVGIQGDLLYSQQGAEFDGGEIDLNYVNIPVVLKYFLTESIHIHGGPQFGFVVDDNVKSVFQDIEEDVDSKSFDLTGVIGVGVDLPFGIRLDGRYNFGLTDVFEGGDGKNSVVIVSAGYSFL